MQDSDLSLVAPPLFNIIGLIQKPKPKDKTTETAILRTTASTIPNNGSCCFIFCFVFFFYYQINRIVPYQHCCYNIEIFPSFFLIRTW